MAGPGGGGATTLQEVARRTGGVVTPANVVDAVAFAGARWAGPRLDTWGGITVGAASYLADVVDGRLARATGTASRIGELVDHVGDKPKIGYALLQAWRKSLADRRLLACVGAYNVATASIAVYDRLANGRSNVEVTPTGKRAMFTTASGVGLQVVGTRLRRDHPSAGRLVSRAGGLLGYGGLVVYGGRTLVQYWAMATGGDAAPGIAAVDPLAAAVTERLT